MPHSTNLSQEMFLKRDLNDPEFNESQFYKRNSVKREKWLQ